ncbi:unnamed protein product [Heligmosomoides polygyrus]|uniref:Nicastrin n=1 Tax=Heligmosomoides polygyrus TaxID=6339 RepID=A0A183GWZ9_HELPZ|nr:unnamed protein product [Heligmosomoides polygyrus]
MHPSRLFPLLLSFVSISLASECHPIINELSSTSAKVQYFELALNEACFDNSHISLNEYGLLVLDTKSRRMGKPDHFNTITFVDFNNHKWPRSEGKLDKYFVVGSSAEESSSFNWNFYSSVEKLAKCSRFVNRPQCLARPIDPEQLSVIDSFFTSPATHLQSAEMPQTVFALVHLPNMGKPDHFNTITFVDFNNHKWPRSEGNLDKYFVVGSSAEESSSFNWNFYSSVEKLAKCSRFVNRPQCLARPIDPEQLSVIDSFFTSPATHLQSAEMPQTSHKDYSQQKHRVSTTSIGRIN